MAYTRPQVQVFQELLTIPTELINPLRAWIAGPNADLHRYAVTEEKAEINLGAYDPATGLTASWPGRSAGGIVDSTYTKVFIDNAVLEYFVDNLSAASTITRVAGYTNRIKSSSVYFAANGTYDASDIMGDRGARVGDRAYLRTVTGVECTVTELTTTIKGFSGDKIASSIGVLQYPDTNADAISASASITKIAGPDNCVTTTVDGSAYSGLVDGAVSEQYTITVVKSSTPGCAAAVLNVISASGLDDHYNVTPEPFGVPTDIGSRGLTVTFDYTQNSGCSADAVEDGIGAQVLAVGQKWLVEVQQTFTPTTATVSPTGGSGYFGLHDDTYIVTVKKGGALNAAPTIEVTTANGLDHSGPTTIPGSNTNVPVGANGLQIKFVGGTGLRAGDQYVIPVISSKAGPYNHLILQHDLPAVMLGAVDIELHLSIVENIELTEKRQNSSTTNWTQNATQILIGEDATAVNADWTIDGELTALPVKGGTAYVEYREWLQSLVTAIGSVQTGGDLDSAIPGPLDPDNPLKWGVHRALSQSNGTAVKFTAVSDPTVLTDWSAALGVVRGSRELYNLVPLTFDADVQAAYAAHANSESGAETQNWKAAFFGLQGRSTKAVVSVDTTADASTVTATTEDDPNATGTQYTLMSTANTEANFVDNVVPGDTVRFLYTVDSYGDPTWTEFTVDSVLSQTSLLLVGGTDTAISVAQKIEIWHTFSKDEMIADLIANKATYNERVCVVWPDIVGSGSTLEPGYFLCAALAGEVSGVSPQQALTHVQVTGYDDFSRSSPFFNATQLDTLAAAGVWIVLTDTNGNAYTRHALTCNMVDLQHREEMIRRNNDAINYYLYNTFAPFIGRCNASNALLTKLRYEFDNSIRFLTNVVTADLGGMLQSGTIRTLEIDPVLADHINVVIDVVRPAPLNNLTIRLVG